MEMVKYVLTTQTAVVLYICIGTLWMLFNIKQMEKKRKPAKIYGNYYLKITGDQEKQQWLCYKL